MERTHRAEFKQHPLVNDRRPDFDPTMAALAARTTSGSVVSSLLRMGAKVTSVSCCLVVLNSGLASAQTFVSRDLMQRLRASAVSHDTTLRVIRNMRITQVAPGVTSGVQLRKGEFLAVTTKPETQFIQGRSRYLFPTRAITTNEQGDLFDLRPFLEPTTSVLELDPDGDTYSGHLLVGVADAVNPAARSIQGLWVVLTSNGPPLSKNQIPLAHTQAPYETVSVSGHVQGPSAKVTMRVNGWPGAGQLQLEIPVPPKPALTISGPRQLPGMGVGVATYTLQLDQTAGLNPRSILVDGENGFTDPKSVKLNGVDLAQVKFRSMWLGKAAVVAKGPAVKDASYPIILSFPTLFLVVALAGGCVGSIIRALIAKGTSPRELWGHFLAGILMGLVVACFYVLGVNVTSVPLPTQDNPVAVFVISVVGSIALTQLFSTWSGVKTILGSVPKPPSS